MQMLYSHICYTNHNIHFTIVSPGSVLQQLLPERGPDVPLRVGGSPQQGRAQDRQQHAAQPEVELQRGDLCSPDIASIIIINLSIAARDLEIHSVSGEYIT